MIKKIHKKIYKDDIETTLGIPYLPSLKLVATELKKHDITTDAEYTADPVLNTKLETKYGELIDQSYTAPIYIKWVNKMVEYGVFADAPIARGEMVCEYTGILCRDDVDNENCYIWDYPTIAYEDVPNKKRRKKIKYCIDAEKQGNFARSINHTIRKYQNVGVVIVPRKNLWHVIYIAQKDIKKGQQLLTYYGTQYWRDRQIVPQPMQP